jgi:ArsR family transcriptional regulator
MKAIATVPCCSPDAPSLAEPQRVALASRVKALADPTRIGIVNCLARTGEACVCDLTESFGLSQPTISHHLRILRDAGLVTIERRGTWSFYRLDRDAVSELALALSP